MAVTPDELRRIAALARLQPDPERAARLLADLNRVLAYVDQLRSADVEAVEEEEPALDSFREPGAEPDPLAVPPPSFAPEWRDGFFVVPRLPGVEGS